MNDKDSFYAYVYPYNEELKDGFPDTSCNVKVTNSSGVLNLLDSIKLIQNIDRYGNIQSIINNNDIIEYSINGKLYDDALSNNGVTRDLSKYHLDWKGSLLQNVNAKTYKISIENIN